MDDKPGEKIICPYCFKEHDKTVRCEYRCFCGNAFFGIPKGEYTPVKV